MTRALIWAAPATALSVALGLCRAPLAEGPADGPDPKGYVCYRAAKPIVLDGRPDDAAWAAAPWSDEFADIEGGAKAKPRHRTRMKMLWDDDALYIAAELDEPHIWGNLKDHDSVIFQDPDFEVFIDPDGDGHNYAELELNALNTTWDLLLTKPYKDGGKALNGWEAVGLKTAVRLDGTLNNPADGDRGWTVEIAWPWKGLKELSDAAAPPKNGDRWRVNFSRVEWDVDVVGGKYVKVKGRPEHNWVWSPQGVIDMHRPERWGYVQFSDAEPGTSPFVPDPDAATKNLLHRVYYAQRRHKEEKGTYADTLSDLGVKPPEAGRPVPVIRKSITGYETSLTTQPAADRKPARWVISQDARIRRE